MLLHVIRFRKAWQALILARKGPFGPLDLPAALELIGRIDLPATIDPLWGQFRVWREFREPPGGHEGERLVVRLRRVPGLTSLRLDGLECPITGLEPLEAGVVRREGGVHRIELEVMAADLGPEACRGWGEIALEIEAAQV